MNSYEKNFIKYLNNTKINACKECTLEELNSDNFYEELLCNLLF